MIKVAALTSGKNVPSARFRISQHVIPLRDMGIEVVEYPAPIGKNYKLPGILGRIRQRYVAPLIIGLMLVKLITRLPGVILSRKSDVIWLNRELVTGIKSFEIFLKKPIILDVDDAIWLKRPFIKEIAKNCDAIIAGNSYIADWFKNYCNKVYIVSTAIDTSRFKPSSIIKEKNNFIIGWTGSSDNLHYLYDIEKPLNEFLKNHSCAKFVIICDKPPSFKLISKEKIEFVKWTPENEAIILNNFDIGIMPLKNTDWEKGKCSFKMLQYMATGIPVCVSPVGMNQEIIKSVKVGFSPISEEEWYLAMKKLYDNPILRSEMGVEGRVYAEKFFSREVISKKLSEILHEIAFI